MARVTSVTGLDSGPHLDARFDGVMELVVLLRSEPSGSVDCEPGGVS